MSRVVVIGGGVAGLATAGLLARDGHTVKLLEQNARIGGRAGVVEEEGFRFDTGPSWYLMPRVFDHFFELMGTSTAEQLDLRLLDPGYRVFAEPGTDGGHPGIIVPHGAERVAAAFERIEPGSGSALGEYLRSSAHTARMAEQYFLYNPFTDPRSLLAPDVLRGVPKLARLLGTTLERHVAARFADALLRQVLGYPAVFLGTDPSRAPAMYHLMSALDLDEGVQYPMGGFWGLVERIAALTIEAGSEIVTGAEVTEIRTDGRPRSAVRGVRWRDADGRMFDESADIVVSAADLHHTETQLLAPADRSYPEQWWRRRRSGPGAVIGLLGVDGSVPQLEHHSLFFTRDWAKNFAAIFGPGRRIPDPASMYVCKPSQTEAAVAPDGHENLFVLIPVPPAPEIGAGGRDGSGSRGVERALDGAIERLSAWAEIADLRDRIVYRRSIGPADFVGDYHSWSGGMLGPAHTLGQSAMFRAQNQSKRVLGLYYAGATTAPGVGVPMCLISAELVLKRIRGDRTAGPSQSVPVPPAALPGSASA